MSSAALDTEITVRDVLDLTSADAISALFARLRFNTDARVTQTAGNLGITAEGIARAIRKIERIADQPGPLQVYLFELTNVTVANTRGIARAFRNLTGNFLLVLTHDYERLDFVLLERYAGTDEPSQPSLAPKQPGIRPRVLTVDRRKPSTVDLRVLRRLTWTEIDAFAQYDKWVSAFGIAYWSEEFFNNRALFSDYYLKSRLPEFPIWKDDPKPAYSRFRDLYRGAGSSLSGKPEGTLRAELLEPAFSALGFEHDAVRKNADGTPSPDYRLAAAGAPDTALVFCLAYPWGRSLDGKDSTKD